MYLSIFCTQICLAADTWQSIQHLRNIHCREKVKVYFTRLASQTGAEETIAFFILLLQVFSFAHEIIQRKKKAHAVAERKGTKQGRSGKNNLFLRVSNDLVPQFYLMRSTLGQFFLTHAFSSSRKINTSMSFRTTLSSSFKSLSKSNPLSTVIARQSCCQFHSLSMTPSRQGDMTSTPSTLPTGQAMNTSFDANPNSLDVSLP